MRFPTEVTYTLQPSATSVHVQQGPQTMVSSSQKYTNYTPSAQYSQAYYPTAVLQCCPPSTHMDALSSCVTPAASSYAHCNYFQSPEYIYTIHTAQPVENTTMQESAAIQQAHVKLKEQLSHNPSPTSVVFVQEGLPFSTHQVDASTKCQTNPPENILPSEQMGFLISEVGPASKRSKDAGLSTPARYRERRSNSQQGKSPDLHLLVDVACKQEHFPKEEELKE
ncbi:hypothetical protein CB1_000552030 [Camelus ferus]|nr:hypothetical protein CB1_000552030 [Camelus ferus]